jgi:hypothetical protein
MKKLLTDRLPKKEERKLVQGRVNAALYEKVKAVLKTKNIEWQDLIEAALEQFLEEQK